MVTFIYKKSCLEVYKDKRTVEYCRSNSFLCYIPLEDMQSSIIRTKVERMFPIENGSINNEDMENVRQIGMWNVICECGNIENTIFLKGVYLTRNCLENARFESACNSSTLWNSSAKGIGLWKEICERNLRFKSSWQHNGNEFWN